MLFRVAVPSSTSFVFEEDAWIISGYGFFLLLVVNTFSPCGHSHPEIRVLPPCQVAEAGRVERP
jgi:hypothetical protein